MNRMAQGGNAHNTNRPYGVFNVADREKKVKVNEGMGAVVDNELRI